MYCHMVYVVKTAYTLESIVDCMYMYYLTTPYTEYTDGAPKNQKKNYSNSPERKYSVDYLLSDR